jgi:hypothetical protein
MAGFFFLLTVMAHCFSVYNQTLLPAGFLWIGFPIRGDKLLRVGLVSIDTSDPGHHGSLTGSFSIFEVTLLRRTIRVMLPVPVQYCEMEWVNRPVNADGNSALKLLW